MLSAMSVRDFDDPALLAALRGYLAALDRLAQISDTASARDFVDEAEAKSIAGMRLKRELVSRGWTAPAPVRAQS